MLGMNICMMDVIYSTTAQHSTALHLYFVRLLGGGQRLCLLIECQLQLSAGVQQRCLVGRLATGLSKAGRHKWREKGDKKRGRQK